MMRAVDETGDATACGELLRTDRWDEATALVKSLATACAVVGNRCGMALEAAPHGGEGDYRELVEGLRELSAESGFPISMFAVPGRKGSYANALLKRAASEVRFVEDWDDVRNALAEAAKAKKKEGGK